MRGHPQGRLYGQRWGNREFTSPRHSKSNPAAIIGGILGGLAILLLLCAFPWYLRRSRRRTARESVWVSPREYSGTSVLLDHSASNTSSLFLTADGGTDETATSAYPQVAPTYRHGAISQPFAAPTQDYVNSAEPMIQSESLPVSRPTPPLIAPAIPSTQSLVTSSRLVVAEPLRSADIRAQDPDPFADTHSRSDTMVYIESPTINGPLPNPFLDPGLFPPKGRAAAWESQMDSARTSMLGSHGHAANLEIMRQSLLSDASAEALVEVSHYRVSCTSF